jgi:hypothetical protein
MKVAFNVLQLCPVLWDSKKLLSLLSVFLSCCCCYCFCWLTWYRDLPEIFSATSRRARWPRCERNESLLRFMRIPSLPDILLPTPYKLAILWMTLTLPSAIAAADTALKCIFVAVILLRLSFFGVCTWVAKKLLILEPNFWVIYDWFSAHYFTLFLQFYGAPKQEKIR